MAESVGGDVMILGYNTNGLAHHDLFDAIDLLAEIGYRSVAITIDHGALAPDDPRTPEQLDRLRDKLLRRRMRSVIETGARFLLDPRRKHEPTLVSPDAADRARRCAFYEHAIRCAASLGSDCVSIWSGVLHDDATREVAWSRLVEGLRKTLDYAADHGVTVAFEPEPGMFVDTMNAYEGLRSRLGDRRLRLTIDIGHLHCQGEPIAGTIRRWWKELVNAHLEDMRRGVHEHLMFGEGEIDFEPALRELVAIGFAGSACVELSRHSHEGPAAARRAYNFLQPILERTLLGDE